jgi:amidohydrolase
MNWTCTGTVGRRDEPCWFRALESGNACDLFTCRNTQAGIVETFMNADSRFTWAIALAACLFASHGIAQSPPAARQEVQSRLQREYPSLFELYKHLHARPELSLHEEQSAARVADELRKAGYEVTTGVGRNGVVGVLRNGAGPTVLVRADMDALPVQEQTGLPYASSVVSKDSQGKDVPVMHACGHDMHMTCLVGTARLLAQLRELWHGTLVLIGQPAEEAGGGAHAMLADGLFERFPRPEFCLAIHGSAQLAAGTVGYTPGFSGANVDAVDIVVHGVGGHGAYPQDTKDPVVLASQIVLALQTIVSREVRPGDPAVVTVGTVHGGTKRNVIPDTVVLQLTVRSYADDVRRKTLDAIKRIARGQAIAAGISEDHLPEVRVADEFTPALYNDPALTERLTAVLKGWLGETNLISKPPSMGGEDFAEYGRVKPRIPICALDVGGVDPGVLKESQRTGKPLPSLHSSLWAPVPEPSIKTGVSTLTACVLELMGKQPAPAQR